MMWEDRYVKDAGITDFINKRRTNKFTKDLFESIGNADEANYRNRCLGAAAEHRKASDEHFAKGAEEGTIFDNKHFRASDAHKNAANAWAAHITSRLLPASEQADYISNQTFGLASDLSDAAWDASGEANG
jgi:hypothetical protein